MNDTHHTMEHNHIMEGMGEMDHSSVQMGGMDHHAMMVQDFKRRFWVSLTVMIPIMILSPMIQMFLGVDWRFPGGFLCPAGPVNVFVFLRRLAFSQGCQG